MTLFKQDSFDPASTTNEQGEIVVQGAVQPETIDVEESLAAQMRIAPPIFATGPVVTILNQLPEGQNMATIPTPGDPTGQGFVTLRVSGSPRLVASAQSVPQAIPIDTETVSVTKAEEISTPATQQEVP